MLSDHFIKDIPDFGPLFFNQPFGTLDGGGRPSGFQLVKDEWLEQFQRHFFRQPALMETQLWSHDDHGTAGIIDTLTEQVLPEPSLLSLQHVAQRFQWAFVR